MNEDDANKWSATMIDLFKDFEKIKLADMKAWADAVWTSNDADLTARDGQSTTYARKVLSEIIFVSIDPHLQKSIQNSISTLIPYFRMNCDIMVGSYSTWRKDIHTFVMPVPRDVSHGYFPNASCPFVLARWDK
jgi:hypothetical protein